VILQAGKKERGGKKRSKRSRLPRQTLYRKREIGRRRGGIVLDRILSRTGEKKSEERRESACVRPVFCPRKGQKRKGRFCISSKHSLVQRGEKKRQGEEKRDERKKNRVVSRKSSFYEPVGRERRLAKSKRKGEGKAIRHL